MQDDALSPLTASDALVCLFWGGDVEVRVDESCGAHEDVYGLLPVAFLDIYFLHYDEHVANHRERETSKLKKSVVQYILRIT